MTRIGTEYIEAYEQYRAGESCQYPPVLERFIIPKHAKRLRRGWVWYEDLDPGDPEVGPQPNVARFVLPRVMCARVLFHIGKTIVKLPAEYAYENGLETVEERARRIEDEEESRLWRYAR